MYKQFVNRKYLSKEEGNFLVTMKLKLEKMRVQNKKQSHSSDHFMLESSLYDRFYELIFRFKTLQVAAIEHHFFLLFLPCPK